MNGNDQLALLAGLSKLGDLVFQGLNQRQQEKNAKSAFDTWLGQRKDVSLPGMPGKLGIPEPDITVPHRYSPRDYAELVSQIDPTNPYGQRFLSSAQSLVEGSQTADQRELQLQARRIQAEDRARAAAEKVRESKLKSLDLFLDPKGGNMELNPDLQQYPDRYMEALRTLTETGDIPQPLTVDKDVMGPLGGMVSKPAKIPILTARRGKESLQNVQYKFDNNGDLVMIGQDAMGNPVVRRPQEDPGQLFNYGQKARPKTGRAGGLSQANKIKLDTMKADQVTLGAELNNLHQKYQNASPTAVKKLETQRAKIEKKYQDNKTKISVLEKYGSSPAAAPTATREKNPLTGKPIGQ